MHALADLGLFAAKTFIIFFFILLILLAFLLIVAKAKQKQKGKLTIKDLNKKYEEIADEISFNVLSKKQFKTLIKNKKAKDKAKHKEDKKPPVFVLNFNGDMRASQVTSLTEEINALLSLTPLPQEVIVRIESGGGVVHGYGLAASQLLRLREKNIQVTAAVDKIAASGGYLMAAVANKILAAPFAIIGSIGVIVQLPNFHRFLQKNHIDFKQVTAGKFKRTISLFGEDTKEGEVKLQEEIEDVQILFKNLITTHRQTVDIEKVSTGEHWLAKQALTLSLVDELKTSDAYLLEKSKEAPVYELAFEIKKPMFSRLSARISQMFSHY